MTFYKVIEIEVVKGSFPLSRKLSAGERDQIGAAAQSLPEGKYDVCFYYTEDPEDRGYAVYRHGLLDLECVCPRQARSAAFCDCIED